MQFGQKLVARASVDARNNVGGIWKRADKGDGTEEEICFTDRLDQEGLKTRFFV